MDQHSLAHITHPQLVTRTRVPTREESALQSPRNINHQVPAADNARDGGPTNRPTAAARSSDRNSTGTTPIEPDRPTRYRQILRICYSDPSMLDGATVTVVTDPSQDQVDQYGRTLAYLELGDGTDYSVATVQMAYARAYTSDHHPMAKVDATAVAQAQAQAAHAGIWGPPCHGATASIPTGR